MLVYSFEFKYIIQNPFQICSKSIQRVFKIYSKSVRNLFQIYSKSVRNQLKIISKFFPHQIFLNNQDLLVYKSKYISMEIYYVLDASAFINGFKLISNNNFTVPEITAEIKDFESKLFFDMAIDEGKLIIRDVPLKYTCRVNNIISVSGDILRLSLPDKKLISLAYMLHDEGHDVKVISDDYTIQNALKIMDIPYSGVITEGIKGIYNWKMICEGCKREYGEDYPFEDCEVCGSRLFKKRIKVDK